MPQDLNSSSGVTAPQPVEDVATQTDPAQTDVQSGQQEPAGEDFHKNKAIEFERKFTNSQRELQEVKETLQEIKAAMTQPAQSNPQYSEDQLEAALSSGSLTSQQESYARSELNRIRSEQAKKDRESLRNEIKQDFKNEQTRIQAEQAVLSDPRFSEAFVKLPGGQVQWNQQSPLAAQISSYLNTPDLKDRPDGILIAAKLAYADTAAVQGQTNLVQARREAQQAKGRTLVEGGGVPHSPGKVDPFRDSMSRLKQGDKHAGRDAVKEFLKRRDSVAT